MADAQDQPTLRATGRPQSIDPDTVAGIALTLFAEHGYDAVSMAQIADAAGIGRKSLYRYFASKADLVWGGLNEAATVSRTEMADAENPSQDPLDALLTATTAALRSLPDLEVTRGRLRLIAEQPELLAQAPVRTVVQNQQTMQYLMHRGLSELDSHYLSVAYGSVTMTAWIRWAQSDEPSPLPFLTQSLTVLRVP
ncbi:TetR family transcriptional regulator [Glutamicibacter sp. NPDC087344]|uniref:TetR family transcriptional regulator n=1 Tax=Glutamicibacter sp. NPDC087344 TaxID=3363994 RepID=UPI0037F2E076